MSLWLAWNSPCRLGWPHTTEVCWVLLPKCYNLKLVSLHRNFFYFIVLCHIFNSNTSVHVLLHVQACGAQRTTAGVSSLLSCRHYGLNSAL